MNSIIATSASALMLASHAYHTYHGIPATYQRMRPSIALVKSIGSTRNSFDVNGPRIHELRGAGTGFVINIKGKKHIITNYHIIADSEEITVKFGKEKVKTQIEYADPLADVAILELPDQSIRALGICSHNTIVGEPVIAIGHPFGLDTSVTSGIVSGLDRSNDVLENLIQTDAAINPGNSGGPLISLNHSCVLGMNTSIVSPSGGSSGVGFAMPLTNE